MPNYQFHSPCRLHILPLPSEISENGTTFFGKSEKRLSRESCSSCLSSLAHYLKEASVVQTICILLSPHLYTHRREITSKQSQSLHLCSNFSPSDLKGILHTFSLFCMVFSISSILVSPFITQTCSAFPLSWVPL